MIIHFDLLPPAPGAPRTIAVRAGEWTIALLRRDRPAGHAGSRWVITEAFGYMAGDEGLAFASLFHARCWCICRLDQSGRALLHGRVITERSRGHGPDDCPRALH